MNPEGCFSTIRFSTADLPEKDRAAMWRDHYCRMAMKLDIKSVNDLPLECAILARTLPGVHVMSTAMSPARIKRTREFLTDGNGDLIFLINQSGLVAAHARGRDVVLREGDAILMSASEVKVFDRPSHGGSLSFRIPHSILSSLIADVDDAVMQLIPQNTEVLKLLAGYAAPLFNDVALASPEFRRTAVNHLHDLVALALGARHDMAALASGRGVPAATAKNGQGLHYCKQQPARPLGWKCICASWFNLPQSSAAVRERRYDILRVFAGAATQPRLPHADRAPPCPERCRCDRL